jgi:hypothetical protein
MRSIEVIIEERRVPRSHPHPEEAREAGRLEGSRVTAQDGSDASRSLLDDSPLVADSSI